MFLLVPAYPGSPGQKAVKRLCACVRACVRVLDFVGVFFVLFCFFFDFALSPSKLLVGHQAEHAACKNCDEMLAWLCVSSEVQIICIWSS